MINYVTEHILPLASDQTTTERMKIGTNCADLVSKPVTMGPQVLKRKAEHVRSVTSLPYKSMLIATKQEKETREAQKGERRKKEKK